MFGGEPEHEFPVGGGGRLNGKLRDAALVVLNLHGQGAVRQDGAGKVKDTAKLGPGEPVAVVVGAARPDL